MSTPQELLDENFRFINKIDNLENFFNEDMIRAKTAEEKIVVLQQALNDIIPILSKFVYERVFGEEEGDAE